MAKVIRCECGFEVRGATLAEVLERIEAHMRADHPRVAGKVSREDLAAMAAEA